MSSDCGHALERAAARARQLHPELERWTLAFARGHRARLLHSLQLAVEHLDAREPVLDVGCLPPLGLVALQSMGYSMIALDLAPQRYGRVFTDAAVPAVQCDVERHHIPLASDSVGGILLLEVFEHLRIDIPHTIAELYRVLRPGGCMLLSTPNLLEARRLWTLLLRHRTQAIGPEYRKLHGVGHMGHVRIYTAPDVADLVSEYGFSVERIHYHGAMPFSRSPRSLILALLHRTLPFTRRYFTLVLRKERAGSPP